MTIGTVRIDGRKFRIIPEEEYKALQSAMRSLEREAKLEAAELAQAQRRVKDPKRKTIPLGRLKAELGL